MQKNVLIFIGHDMIEEIGPTERSKRWNDLRHNAWRYHEITKSTEPRLKWMKRSCTENPAYGGPICEERTQCRSAVNSGFCFCKKKKSSSPQTV